MFFHAASTIKVGILIGIFKLIEDGVLKLNSLVHVRNRFFSLVDNKLFQTESSRDGCPELYKSLGRNLSISELAYHMIVTSSNLATNLLIDLVGVKHLQQNLNSLQLTGIELLRGVEDELAWEKGINNQINADGLLNLFRFLYESKGISPELSKIMLDILLQQAFNNGIPVGLPIELRKVARFAHKTGEISSVAHDAGLVFLPERQPYALAILTERADDKSKNRLAIQRISKLVYDSFIRTSILEKKEYEIQ